MTKPQWKALYDYCDEFDCTKYELLAELKANGVVDRNAEVEDLGDYAENGTYDAMMEFLIESL